MMNKYYHRCVYMSGLKWRRFVIILIFGIIFTFAVIKNEENILAKKYNIEKSNQFYKSYHNNYIDKVDNEILHNIDEIGNNHDLQYSPTRNKIRFEDGKLHNQGVIKEENEEIGIHKTYSEVNSFSHKNSSNFEGLPFHNKKHLCRVPSVIPPILTQRRDHAMAACKRLKKHLPKRWRMRHIRWEKHLNIVYCHVPKAASTTWSWHLLRAIGLKDDIISKSDSVHNLLKKYLPYPSVEDAKKGVLDSALKFLVTRHPFERLVSAYQNKIADPLVEHLQYRELQKKIISQYYGDLPASSQPIIPSFRDFCRYVIDELEEWMRDSDNNGLNPPDHHWSPQTYICSPCKIRYHVLSDMSTLDQDTAYIAQQCNLEDVIKVHEQLNQSPVKPVSQLPMGAQIYQSPDNVVIHSSTNTNKISMENINRSEKDMYFYDKNTKNENSKEKENKRLKNMVIEKEVIYGDISKNETFGIELSKSIKQRENDYMNYFNQLDKKEIKHLYNLYRFDFEIFGYEIQDYLKS